MYTYIYIYMFILYIYTCMCKYIYMYIYVYRYLGIRPWHPEGQTEPGARNETCSIEHTG